LLGMIDPAREEVKPALQIPIDRLAEAGQMLQQVRDEAHRFAIGYFQKVHKKRTFVSALDSITGIGPKKKKALLKRFGSVPGIKAASIEELAGVKGIDLALAQKIKDNLI